MKRLSFVTLLLVLLSTASAQQVVYNFSAPPDAGGPEGAMVFDSAGNLYGTTQSGGAFNLGALWEIAPGGAETVLYSFTGGPDGEGPMTGLVIDAQGNLYGTTPGLQVGKGCPPTCGSVFEFSAGAFTVLHTFLGRRDGGFLQGPVILDSEGNIYGTTANGGTHKYAGTVFRITDGVLTTIHNFAGSPYGIQPAGPLALDAGGAIYGTTVLKGKYGYGTIFRLAAGTYRMAVLHSFNPGGNMVGVGVGPLGLFSGASNDPSLYGSTTKGPGNGYTGSVYRLTPKPSGGFSVRALYHFPQLQGQGWENPIMDAAGNFYGTTLNAFKRPPEVYQLYFDGSFWQYRALCQVPNWDLIYSKLVFGPDGNLYGTTLENATGYGAVFNIAP